MSLNDLKLSPAVLAALYPSSLIAPEQEESFVHVSPAKPVEERLPEVESPVIAEAGWKYLGNNRKNILVVVNYTDVVHLPDEELGFLTNMLTACKLSLADVAIVNMHNYPGTSYKSFISEFKSRIVFLFGVDPGFFQLPVSFPQFQVQTVANCTFLYTPALDVQRKDSLLKSKLWVSLRSIFSL